MNKIIIVSVLVVVILVGGYILYNSGEKVDKNKENVISNTMNNAEESQNLAEYVLEVDREGVAVQVWLNDEQVFSKDDGKQGLNQSRLTSLLKLGEKNKFSVKLAKPRVGAMAGVDAKISISVLKGYQGVTQAGDEEVVAKYVWDVNKTPLTDSFVEVWSEEITM